MKNRGLALGIVSMGSGVGTLFLVPGNERLISAFGWSSAFIILGCAAGILMMAVALLLRPAPQAAPASDNLKTSGINSAARQDPTVWQAVKDVRLLLLMGAFLMFFFSIQIIMVHLVNYATDLGIAPLIAATFVSVISLASIGGRFFMGVSAGRIDIHYTLLLTRILLIVAFICLLFTRSVWSFYLFAVVFGVPYGGEIPQIPLFIGNYFGTRSMATLVGISSFVMNVGGALGSWAAGKIFDSTRSYNGAFLAGLATASVSLILIVLLKKHNPPAA
jgi:predicted MFS family arabinose efflux permease